MQAFFAARNDKSRNNMILPDVLKAVRRKRSPLVLTERTEHLHLLAERLNASVKNVLVLKVGMGKRQRVRVAETIAAIPECEERVLVATGRYLGEGFDDARLDTLFLTLPISWRGTLAQYAGRLNLAGLLLFGEKPQVLKSAFCVKAVCYPGTDVAVEEYLDSEDFEGPLSALFDGGMGFILRNLRKIQRGRGVNTVGVPEIPRIVFEQLLVNALVHRDYLISAPIRVFVFSDRVEIINPGSLPNHLTVAKIQTANSVIRNAVPASFVAKGLLPYRGLGTGVRRRS
jgi:hypothetical protein